MTIIAFVPPQDKNAMVSHNNHDHEQIPNFVVDPSHNSIIITVEELERRKDRLRRATKQYYEQAERNYRLLHGFCTPLDHHYSKHHQTTIGSKKRKRSSSSASSTEDHESFPPKFHRRGLKRCRASRNAAMTIVQRRKIGALEKELARCLLLSSFAIVELSIEEYLVAITGLVRIVPEWWKHFEVPQGVAAAGGGESSCRGPEPNKQDAATATVATDRKETEPEPESCFEYLPLPLPLLFERMPTHRNRAVESLPGTLRRHASEVLDEKHTAVAAAMAAVRETELTHANAATLVADIDSVALALRKVGALVEAHGTSTLHCIHYDGVVAPTVAASHRHRSQNHLAVVAVRPRNEALRLDGYYRWFRAHNGVLLVGSGTHLPPPGCREHPRR